MAVIGNSSVRDAILANAIFSNGGLGIDLGGDGVTLNDSKGHTGPNHFQNFPVLTAANGTSAGTTITGNLNSTPAGIFRLEFFANSAADPSGFGQGQTLLGATQDIGTDGVYVTTLSPGEQAKYLGFQSMCWNGGALLAKGPFLSVSGILEKSTGSYASAWMIVMLAMGKTPSRPALATKTGTNSGGLPPASEAAEKLVDFCGM